MSTRPPGEGFQGGGGNRGFCFLCSRFIAIVPRFTSGISAISSATIIFLIFQSNVKLKTIYHRLMFGMSCADICGSLAMGLTTLPMPVELPTQFPYNSTLFHGTRLGNDQTCEAQGFSVLFGATAMFAYNLTLCIYNTCVIYFGMREERIRKRIEPFLHLVPVVTGLGISIYVLVKHLIRIVPIFPWCFAIPKDIFQGNTTVLPLLCGIWFGAVGICFILIIYRVLSRDLFTARLHRQHVRRSVFANRSEEIEHALKNTKVLTIHALAYFVSFFLTLGLVLFRVFIKITPIWLIYASMVMMPLQGFFNLLIFIGQKVYNFRRVHPDISRWDTIKILFRGTYEEPVLFLRLSLVRFDQERREVDYEYADEGGNEQIHSIQHDAINGTVTSPSQSLGAEGFVDSDGRSTRRDDADLEDLSAFQSHGRVGVANEGDPSQQNSSSRGGLSGFSSNGFGSTNSGSSVAISR